MTKEKHYPKRRNYRTNERLEESLRAQAKFRGMAISEYHRWLIGVGETAMRAALKGNREETIPTNQVNKV